MPDKATAAPDRILVAGDWHYALLNVKSMTWEAGQ